LTARGPCNGKNRFEPRMVNVRLPPNGRDPQIDLGSTIVRLRIEFREEAASKGKVAWC
jgi:hypothetical protein